MSSITGIPHSETGRQSLESGQVGELKPAQIGFETAWDELELPPDLRVSVVESTNVDSGNPEYIFIVYFDGEDKAKITADCSIDGFIAFYDFTRPENWGIDSRTSEELTPEYEIIIHAVVAEAIELPGVEEVVVAQQRGAIGYASSLVGQPPDWEAGFQTAGGWLTFGQEGLSPQESIRQVTERGGNATVSYMRDKSEGAQVIPFPVTA